MDKKKDILLWTFLSGIIIIAIGTGWHFLNDWLGFIPVIHSIAPVNESVWEHLKLTLWPVLIVWLIIVPLMKLSKTVDMNKAMVASALCMLCANAVILGIHYTLISGFNIENIYTDIASYAIGILFGQFITAIVIIPFEIPKWIIITGWVVILSAISIYGFFSYHPAEYPIFHSV